MSTSHTLISLAILKVNWDERRKDYMDNYVPFVAQAIKLSTLKDTPISLPIIQDTLVRKFGLVLPQHIIENLLRRAKRQDLIYIQNGAYYPRHDNLETLRFRELQQDVIKQYEELINAFVEFCLGQHSVNISFEESENAFEDFVQENGFQISQSYEISSVFPAEVGDVRHRDRYLVGAFINNLVSTESYLLNYLDSIVKGSMLANAIFLPDPGQASRKFRNTNIYFDTSFIIYALGYGGKARQKPCLELLELLYETGANLRCFRHTADEIRGILNALAHRMEQGDLDTAYGPSIEYFVAEGYNASDIRLCIASLEKNMRAKRIQIVDTPDFRNHEHVIDEQEFQNNLTERLKYSKILAAKRDVRSISAIVRLRQGREPYYVEESYAIFVTTNQPLATITREYFYQKSDHQVVSPCLTDYTLTNLLWLKRPNSSPDLPRKRIIANSYAAIQPSSQLWQSYQEELIKLAENKEISEDDFYLLRYDIQASSLLSETTLGQEEVFSRGTVAEILLLIQQRVKSELQSELESEKTARLNAEAQITQIAGNSKAERDRTIARIENISQRVSSIVVRTLRILIIIILGLGTYFTFPGVNWSFENNIFGILIWIMLAVLFLISLLNLIIGTSVNEYLRIVEMKLYNRIFYWQIRALDIDINNIE